MLQPFWLIEATLERGGSIPLDPLPPLLSEAASAGTPDTISAAQPMPGWETLGWHVLLVTGLANPGKIFPAFATGKKPTGKHG